MAGASVFEGMVDGVAWRGLLQHGQGVVVPRAAKVMIRRAFPISCIRRSRTGIKLSGRSISWELNAMHSSFNDAYGGRGRRSLSWALGRNVSACWA